MATPSHVDGFGTPVYHDFKVVIVCALQLEAYAITALLDERYHGVTQHERDTNTYTFGRLGVHKVVIVHMPKMGGNMANRVSSQVRFSFPRIDLCLVVGICGAIPSYNEDGVTKFIEAGDVIVSTGIVHYQFGRQYSHGFEIRVDDPNAPDGRPTDAIITFLQKIKEPNLLQIIRERAALSSKDYEDSKCESKYERPSELGGKTPSLHFGLFASGEAVYKSTFHRDQLAKSSHVIAFEMEGFGVWPNFSTIIIKGVSDFADDQKHERIQRYAASTAASYVKAFLTAWKVSRDETALILQTTQMKAQLSPGTIRRRTSSEGAVGPSQEKIDHLLFRLTAYDHMQEHQRIAVQRISGTCDWILKTTEFREWHEGNGKNILWLHGTIGSGKTMCVSRIIDYLKRNAACGDVALDPVVEADWQGLVFFYFDSSQPSFSTANSLLESFIKQMTRNMVMSGKQIPAYIPQALKRFCSNQQLGRRNIHELGEVFKKLFDLRNKTTYLIDGLNEMTEADIRLVLTLFRTIDFSANNSKLLFSSRTFLGNNVNLLGIFKGPLEIHMTTEENHDDITRYVEEKFEENSQCMRGLSENQSLIIEIISTLKSKAKGSFLWLSLQIQYLWQFCKTDGDLKEALENLPKDLHDLYDRCWNRLSRSDQLHAEAVLKWVALTKRPLTILEMREAISLQPRDTTLHEDRFVESSLVVSRCGNLVVLDRYDLKIRLAHTSVSTWYWDSLHLGFDRDTGEDNITTLCHVYLGFEAFQGVLVEAASPTRVDMRYNVPNIVDRLPNLDTASKLIRFWRVTNSAASQKQIQRVPIAMPSRESRQTEVNFGNYQLLDYVSKNYMYHTRFLSVDHPLWQRFKEFVLGSKYSPLKKPWLDAESTGGQVHAMINWAARNEHRGLLHLAHDQSVENTWFQVCMIPWAGDGLPALHAALIFGSEDFTSFALTALTRYIQVDYVDVYGRTALMIATEMHHSKLVAGLLQRGADPNARESSCLSIAAKTGDLRIFGLMLQKGAKLYFDTDTAVIDEISQTTRRLKRNSERGKIRGWLEFDPVKSTLFVATDLGDKTMFPAHCPLSLAATAANSGHRLIVSYLKSFKQVDDIWDRLMSDWPGWWLAEVRCENKQWLFEDRFLDGLLRAHALLFNPDVFRFF